MLPTEAFATRTKRKVLRVLAEKNKQYTISELADMCHRSESTVSRAMDDLGRFPFVQRTTVSGSKTLVFRLDPESRYSAPIVEFFEVERQVERQNGTVPVDVWNLLEDLTSEFESGIEGFVEVFLFGSYATGEYYTGSDVDLLVMHTANRADALQRADALVERTAAEKPVQVVSVEVSEGTVTDATDDELVGIARDAVAVDDVELLIPLSGRVGA